MSFHAVVIFGLGKDLLFKSVTPLLLIQSRILLGKPQVYFLRVVQPSR